MSQSYMDRYDTEGLLEILWPGVDNPNKPWLAVYSQLHALHLWSMKCVDSESVGEDLWLLMKIAFVREEMAIREKYGADNA